MSATLPAAPQSDLRSLTGPGHESFTCAPVHRNPMTIKEMLANIAKYGHTEDPVSDEEMAAHDARMKALNDCGVCGESHADRDCPVVFCSVCWDINVAASACCECPDEPTPATAAEWIDEGRPAKRKPIKAYECDHGCKGGCRLCVDEERAEFERDDRAVA